MCVCVCACPHFFVCVSLPFDVYDSIDNFYGRAFCIGNVEIRTNADKDVVILQQMFIHMA